MKKILLYAVVLLLIDRQANSQELTAPLRPKAEFPNMVSVGAGLSLGFAVIQIRTFQFYSSGNLVNVSSTPVITGSFERFMDKNLSFGLAGSYQSFHIAYGYNQVASNGTVYTTSDNHDVYTRVNIAIRILGHFGNNPDWDHYFGFRAGYTFWNLTTDSTDPDYHKRNSLMNMPSGQIIYGFKYFRGPYGIGLEAGLGTAPYLLMANLNYRFGAKKSI